MLTLSARRRASFLFMHRKRTTAVPMTASGITTPIAIFPPDDRPSEGGGPLVGAGVGEYDEVDKVDDGDEANNELGRASSPRVGKAAFGSNIASDIEEGQAGCVGSEVYTDRGVPVGFNVAHWSLKLV